MRLHSRPAPFLLVAAFAVVPQGLTLGQEAARTPAPIPPDDVMEAAGAVIGEVVVDAKDIFDMDVSGENQRIFRWANAIHPKTRAGTVRALLLFSKGTPYTRRILEESARLLRGQRYLYEAEIHPIRYEANTVDVQVTTRDVWTLKLNVGFSREGGSNSLSFGIEDSNFAGFGKELTVKRDSNVDRTGYRFRYRDPAFAGSRVQLALEYQNNIDGNVRSMAAGLPFYCLDCRFAAEVRALSGNRVSTLWDAGEVFSTFEQDSKVLDVYSGWSRGLRGNTTVRYKIGYAYDRETFFPTPSQPLASVVPPSRTLVYPWFEVASLSDAFVAARDVDKLHRIEDLDLGRTLRARVGWMAPVFGADRTGLIVDASAHFGFGRDRSQLLLLDETLTGRFTNVGAQDVVGSTNVRYFRRWSSLHALAFSVQGTMARALDQDTQILAGGDTGLRGYPLRFQAGDRRFVATLEERFYGHREYLHLLRIGGAVFLDIGGAWFHDAPEPDGKRILRDVGAGLRLGSSRSADGSMLHIDVAIPLDSTDTMRRVQLTVTTSDTF